MTAALASAAAACDAGKRHEQRTQGPLVTILQVSVGPNTPLPIDREIQISFDRYLLPASVTRQSAGVVVVDANGQAVDPVITRYDPVSRTVSISGSTATWLTPGQPYKLRFALPPDEEVNDRGFRAIDRAPLDPNQPLEFAFFADDPTGERSEKIIDFCGDILPMFTQRCTNGVCHGSGGGAAAGLVLDSRTGVLATALNRVANGANTSGRSGFGDAPGRVFGVNMPLIKPGEPDNSWLLYKVELARPPTVDVGPLDKFICNVSPTVNDVAVSTVDPVRFFVEVRPADEIEHAALNDFVPGREMPFPTSAVSSPIDQALTFDERQRLRLWIAQGAVMTECGGCTVAAPPASDAGVGDSGDVDAGASDAAADAPADAQDQ